MSEQRIQDYLTRLSNTATAITSSAAGLIDGAAAYVDLGAAAVKGDWYTYCSALTAADHTYVFTLQGSASGGSAFSSTVTLATLTITATGEYVVPFTNVLAGTTYQYVRLYRTLGGSSPSIISQSNLTKERPY